MRISDWSSDVCSSDLSDARIDGRRIDVVVDTGAQSSVGNPALMKLIASRRQNSTAFYPAVLGAITGEDVPAMRTSIKTIEIEGININDLPISFADSKAFEALGLDEDRKSTRLNSSH